MYEIILIIIFMLLITVFMGVMAYKMFTQDKTFDKLYGKIEQNVLEKVKGITKEDVRNLDIVQDSLINDVDDIFEHIKEAGEKIDLPEWPAFSKEDLKSPEIIGSLMATDGLLKAILPLIKGDNPWLNMMNDEIERVSKISNITLKLFETVWKRKKTNKKDKPKAVGKNHRENIDNSKPELIPTKLKGFY